MDKLFVKKCLKFVKEFFLSGIVPFSSNPICTNGGGLSDYIILSDNVRFTVSEPLSKKIISLLLTDIEEVEQNNHYNLFSTRELDEIDSINKITFNRIVYLFKSAWQGMKVSSLPLFNYEQVPDIHESDQCS